MRAFVLPADPGRVRVTEDDGRARRWLSSETDMTPTPDQPMGWARPWASARPFARPMPRAGAWYPVVADAGNERAVLEIHGKRVAIKKRLLEIRPQRPKAFTGVIRSRTTVAAVEVLRRGERDPVYAVCPRCAERVPVARNASVVSCPGCKHRDQIIW